MRIPERGVGNMAFIIVLVLLVIAAAVAFMQGDKASELRLQMEKAEGERDDADRKYVEMEQAYRAVVEVMGLQEQLNPSEGKIPTPDDIDKKGRAWLDQQAAALVAAGTIQVKMPTFVPIESNLEIERQEGGMVTLRWYKSSDAEAVRDVRGFLTPLPGRIKAIADNMKKAVEEYERVYKNWQGDIKTKDDALTEANSTYADDARRKQALIDDLKRSHDEVNDRAQKLVQDVENLRSELENEKTSYKKALLLKDREISAQDNRIKILTHEIEVQEREDPPDGQVLGVGRTRNTVWIDIGRNQKVTRGTKFKVSRVGKGGVREDIAMLRVIRVDPTMSECRVIKQIDPAIRIARGQNVSNPFFDPQRKLTAYIYGDLTNYDTDTARRRLAASGVVVSRYLDDRVNVIVLGQPSVSGEELEGDEMNPEAIATRRRVAREARLEKVMEKAASIGAVVVTESVLRDFVNF